MPSTMTAGDRSRSRSWGLPHPLGDRHALAPHHGPDLLQLLLVQEHLKALTHGMSMTNCYLCVPPTQIPARAAVLLNSLLLDGEGVAVGLVLRVSVVRQHMDAGGMRLMARGQESQLQFERWRGLAAAEAIGVTGGRL